MRKAFGAGTGTAIAAGVAVQKKTKRLRPPEKEDVFLRKACAQKAGMV